MVWGLFPSDSLRGVQKYYLFSKGTYRVGRKDCDIVVQTDTAVSRLHAEIIVDKMVSLDPSNSSSSNVRIIDRSKFGTWVNKELGSKAVRLREKEVATLKDGGSVTFGTGNATFRFCFVPLTFFFYSLAEMDSSLQTIISSIGASVTSNWNTGCTHFLVDHASLVTVDLIEAVVAKKPIVLVDWLKVLVEKNVRTEFPSWTSFLPNLNLEGTLVKIVEPMVRERCLGEYTFVLDSSIKYKFIDKIQALLEVARARFLRVDEFISSSQASTDGESNPLVLVIPGKSGKDFDNHRHLSSLSRITEINLVAAILSANLESSVMEPPSIVVSSSHSTDETFVADSDVEIDTATSDHAATSVMPEGAIRYDDHDKYGKKTLASDDLGRGQDNEKNADSSTYPDSTNILISGHVDVRSIKKIDKVDETAADDFRNSDIIFSQDLIVKNFTMPIRSAPKKVVNFKCFRKENAISGNSFKDLVPFSKDPYKESDYGSNETDEYIKEERKRKQMEAIAEDLFNNEKAKKRANAETSIKALFARHR